MQTLKIRGVEITSGNLTRFIRTSDPAACITRFGQAASKIHIVAIAPVIGQRLVMQVR